jgi:hypothetical protein
MTWNGEWHSSTAGVSHRDGIDGLEVGAQVPHDGKAEEAYWKATAQESYEPRAQARRRWLEWLHDYPPRRVYRCAPS